MKLAHILIAAVICAALSACAGLPPKPEELSKAQQIQFGQPLPQDNDYARLFPASAVLPAATAVEGNILEHEGQVFMPDTHKHNVNAYRLLVCFDSVEWQTYGRLRGIRLEVQIPLRDNGNECFVRVKVAQKNWP